MATYSSSHEAKEALKKAESNLREAKKSKDTAAISAATKEVNNLKLVISKFPKAK